jgi:hypothetical protein
MEQRCGVNEFHDGGQFMVISAAIAIRVGHQQYQYRPYALASGGDNVFRNLIYQRNVGMELAANHRIDRFHVSGDWFDNCILGGELRSGCQDKTCKNRRLQELYDDNVLVLLCVSHRRNPHLSKAFGSHYAFTGFDPSAKSMYNLGFSRLRLILLKELGGKKVPLII